MKGGTSTWKFYFIICVIDVVPVDKVGPLVTFVDMCNAISNDRIISQVPGLVIIGVLVEDVFPLVKEGDNRCINGAALKGIPNHC